MSKKLTLEDANTRLKGKSIKMLSYSGIRKPATATCLVCGHTWTTQANVLLNNSCGCPKCSRERASKKLSYTKETFMESCGELKSDIMMVGPYKGFQEKTAFHCGTCGYDWETTPYMIKKFKTCPNCTKHRKLTHDEFLKRVNAAHGAAYEVLSQYESLSKKIRVRHLECGTEFETNALNFIGTGKKQPCGCPVCSALIKSKGESVISDYLISNNISFERQYRIKECRNKKSLPFDFVVFFDANRKDKFCLIEYDGQHHFGFNQTGIFTEDKYNSIIRNDQIKDNFCRENGIELLRIPHTEFNNIANILDNFFSNRSTTIESTSCMMEASRVDTDVSKHSGG